MKKKEKWIVVGSGFRGLVGAYLLAKQGRDVTLVDKAGVVGGVLQPIVHKGFFLDKGCHLFDNSSVETTRLMMEILDEEVLPVNVKYASFLNNKKSDGLAIPDLSLLGEDTCKEILWETLQRASPDAEQKTKPPHYREYLENRYGLTATKIISGFLQKTHLVPADRIDTIGASTLAYRRIKCTGDAVGRLLKKSEVLDDRLAVSSQKKPLEFYRDAGGNYPHRNFYPQKSGLKHFCDKAMEKLEAFGVEIRLKTEISSIEADKEGVNVKIEGEKDITGDRLLWAGNHDQLGALFGIESKLKEYIFKVPMVLYYFFLDKACASDYSYVHNFNSGDHTFRASIPSNYGDKNAVEGQAYVCAEVPAEINSEIFAKHESYIDTVWEELKKMSMVTGDYLDVLPLKTPVSYKVPLTGYSEEIKKVLEQIDQTRIFGLEDWEFAKNNIIESLYNRLQSI